MVFALVAILGHSANPNGTEKEARDLFTKVYDLVFGDEGSSLTYAVNIIGIYKTEGNIKYKGKKVQYQESRYEAYEDGVTAYMVDKKKQTVNIYRADDDAKDEFLAKFKYDVNNYKFSLKSDAKYHYLTAKIKNASFFGIHTVEAKILKSNLYPESLKITLAVFTTTVKISNFKAENISDSSFVFPKKRFSNYNTVDHR